LAVGNEIALRPSSNVGREGIENAESLRLQRRTQQYRAQNYERESRGDSLSFAAINVRASALHFLMHGDPPDCEHDAIVQGRNYIPNCPPIAAFQTIAAGFREL